MQTAKGRPMGTTRRSWTLMIDASRFRISLDSSLFHTLSLSVTIPSDPPLFLSICPSLPAVDYSVDPPVRRRRSRARCDRPTRVSRDNDDNNITAAAVAAASQSKTQWARIRPRRRRRHSNSYRRRFRLFPPME